MNYYNEFQEVVKKPTLLASLIGFVNPATILPIIAIGGVVYVIKKAKKLADENEDLKKSKADLQTRKNSLAKRNQFLEGELEEYFDAEYEEVDEHEGDDLTVQSEPNVTLSENPTVESQPFNGSQSAEMLVTSAVEATVAQPLNPTVTNGAFNGLDNGSPTVENMTDEQLKKEMLRQAMSELGKRSAAARARKKNGGS